LAEGYSAASGPLAAAFRAGAATAPTGPFLPDLSAGGILAATARFGGPLAFLSALLHPKSTAADDTCENGRCTSVFTEEKTADPPPADSEEDVASAKGDATTREGAPFSWIHKKRHKTNDQLKADHEGETGEVGPTAPETGNDMHVSHEEPLADGGTDHVSNIRPRTQKDHVDLHKEYEDFARWAKRKGQNP